jgi:hypothetical protein
MPGARKNNSRSEELVCAAANCVMGNDLDDIQAVLNQFSRRPHGDLYEHANGTKLVWGNIERLLGSDGHTQIADLSNAALQYQLPRTRAPKYVVLMDSFRRTTAFQGRISDEALNILKNVKGKADLAVIEDATIRKVSVKQAGLTEVKLGQQSRREEYEFFSGTSVLSGGKNLDGLREGMLDLTTQVGDIRRPSSLSVSQWEKLSEEDKRLATAKQSFPDQWREVVRQALISAGAELDQFLDAALSGNKREHAYNLGVLLSHRLIGGMTQGHEEWITSARGPFRLEIAIQRLAQMDTLSATWLRRPSRSGKDSWVITSTVNGKRYTICKIEPSFDGSKPNVSQTKGVIYYFQEGSSVRAPGEGSVWDLLSDISG